MKNRMVVAVLAALTAACSSAESNSTNGAPGGAGGRPAMPVEVAAARLDTVVDAISATGEIEALQSIELRPEVEGRLVDILVREGREVGVGQPLFKVDDAELKARVAQLEAERDLAEQTLARTRELIEQNLSSEEVLDQALASARAAQAALDLQELRLRRTVVRAPFTGLVGERYVSVGDYVNSQTRLVSLQTVDPQRAAFRVPERYAQRLKENQPC